MKRLLKLIIVTLLATAAWPQTSHAASGDAEALATLYREIEGRMQAAHADNQDFWIQWPNCQAGTKAPYFPSKDFYAMDEDDPDAMVNYTWAAYNAAYALMGTFDYTQALGTHLYWIAPGSVDSSGSLEGKGSTGSAISFPTVGPITAGTYRAAINTLTGFVRQLKYVGVSSQFVDTAAKVGQVTYNPSDMATYDRAKGDVSAQWTAASSQPNTSYFSQFGGGLSNYAFLNEDQTTKFAYFAEVISIQGRVSLDLSDFDSSATKAATAYIKFSMVGQGGQPPVPADGLYHELPGSSPVVGDVWSSDLIGDTEPPLSPEGSPSTYTWWASAAVGVLELAPRTEADDVKCKCACNGDGGQCDVQTSIGSVRVQIGLGNANYGTPAGNLYLYSLNPDVRLSQRSMLTTGGSGFTNGVAMVQDTGGIRQVVTPFKVVDLVTITPQKYEVRFYERNQSGSSVGGVYQPTGTPEKVITMEDPDGAGKKLRVTRTQDAVNRVDEFSWDDDTQSWTLSKGNGNSNENLDVTWNEDQTLRTETRTVRDSNGVLISKQTSVFQEFAWGEEEISETLDPDGAALITCWQYYADQAGDGSNYSRLKAVTNADGSWERYSYDAAGRIYQTTTPFQNTAFDAANGDCRVTTYVYSDDGYTQTIIDMVRIGAQQTEIRRRYKVLGQNKLQEITCTHQGAAVDDPTNLVTTTTYTSFAFGKQLQKVLRPDGTADIYSYQNLANGAWQTTQQTGQPDQTGESIVDGQQNVTALDAQGNPISWNITDIGSGLLLTSKTATAWDSMGRPIHFSYDDGSSEDTQYVGCCGLAGSVTDREGITTSYTYDVFGNILTESRAGITMVYSYDALNRRVTSSRLGNGADPALIDQRVYNVAGQLATSTNAIGQSTAYAAFLNADGYYERDITYPGGAVSSRLSNADGSPYAVQGTAVHPLLYHYGVDAGSLYTQQIAVGDDGAVSQWVKQYTDFAGRVSKTVYADGATIQTSYNALGQMAQQTDQDNIVTTYGYNAKGEQTTSTVAEVRTTQTIKSVTQRDDGKTCQRTQTSVTSATGGGLTVIETVDQAPNGGESWTTRSGVTTHMKSVPNPATATRTDTVTGPDGSSRVTQYNLGRRTSLNVLDSGGGQLASITFGYDQFGRLQTMADAGGGTTIYSYTDLDEILSTNAPGNLTTTNHYNNARQVDWVQLPDGSKQYSTYYSTGELASRSGSQAYTIAYSYDAQGRMKTLTTYGTAGAATTTWNYSPTRGFLVSKIYPDSKSVTYPQYSAAGRLLQRVWARGVTTTYSYNATGDLASIEYSDGTTPLVQYGYDGRGRRSSITDGSGTRTLSYTDDGQMTSETYTFGLLSGMSATRSYDGLLRRSGLTVTTPDKTLSQAYGYDGGSRINAISSGDFWAGYSYVSNTNLLNQTTLRQSNGATLTASRSYDSANRLAGVSTVSSTAGMIASYGYQINALGQRTSATLADSSNWQYTYDTLGQVTGANHFWSDSSAVAGQQFSYTFDGIGNRTSMTTNGNNSAYTPNVLNQYSQRTVPGVIDVLGVAAPGATVTVNGNTTSGKDGYFYQSLSVANGSSPVYAGITVQGTASGQSMQQTGHAYVPASPESFSYDDDGNLVQDGRWHYTWDGENRLIAMEAIDGAVSAGAPHQKLLFAYDDKGRRVSKQVKLWNGVAWQMSSESRFIYDGWNLVAELDGSNNLLRSYVWGLDLSGTLADTGGIGGLLFEQYHSPSRNETYCPAYDANGNIVKLVEMADGHIREQYEYGPFGESIRGASLRKLNPFQFSTKYTDAETDLVYFGYRYLASRTGRWLSRDPLQEGGGPNVYADCENSAVNRIDQLGLMSLVTAIPNPDHVDFGGQFGGPAYRTTAFPMAKSNQKQALIEELRSVLMPKHYTILDGGDLRGLLVSYVYRAYNNGLISGAEFGFKVILIPSSNNMYVAYQLIRATDLGMAFQLDDGRVNIPPLPASPDHRYPDFGSDGMDFHDKPSRGTRNIPLTFEAHAFIASLCGGAKVVTVYDGVSWGFTIQSRK